MARFNLTSFAAAIPYLSAAIRLFKGFSGTQSGVRRMKVICIIPARYGSKRFPGKPLASETGRPLIQHVYEAAAGARRVDAVFIATDDDRIRAAVELFGGRVVMTRAEHPCGTNRVAEAAAKVGGADIVINLQGDEPELDPALLDLVVETMADDPAIEAATVAGPLLPEEVLDPGAVKVARAVSGDALYFSRAPIPWARDGEADRRTPMLKHFGIYAYRASALQAYAAMSPSPLEETEKLEQLRWLENGRRMRVLVTDQRPTGVDTPADYAAFVARYNKKT
jgi:3-deoxy-manno-octulosonate cytidylyltransferase (CMP-KDO synthetase)